jgi:hypothetical protein
MINTRRLARAQAWVAVLVTTLGSIVWSSSLAAESRVLDRHRYSGTEELDEMNCGRHQHIVLTYRGVTIFKSQGDQPLRLFDNYDIHEVFTEDDGSGYIVDQRGLYSDVRERHARGTLYRYTAINVGSVFTIRTLDGKAVQRDRGLLEITFLMDTLGDSDPWNDVFLEDTLQLVREAGDHPYANQTDAEYCAVIDQAIQG